MPHCRYRGNRRSHSILICRLIVVFWLLPIFHGAVAWTVLSIKYSESYHYNPDTCKCSLPPYTQDKTFIFLFLYLPVLLFMVLPTLFNIGAYILIIGKITKFRFSFGTERSQRQIQTTALAIRALIITSVNLLSWLPFLLICFAFKDRAGTDARKISVLFLYINCIADPFLYICSKKMIASTIQWYCKFSTGIQNIMTISKSGGSQRTRSRCCIPKLVITAANVISASGLFFEEDPVVWAINKSLSHGVSRT